MALLEQPIILEDLPAGGGYDPIPDGWYQATVANADYRNTKTGDGKYIAVQFSITGPSFQGSSVWTNFNTRNSSAKAEEIGRGQLRAMLEAAHFSAQLQDTDQLLGLALQIKVTTRAATGGFGPQNEIKGFRALGDPVPQTKAAPAPATFQASKAAAPAARPTTPPWAKK